jgi:hypothetical protein
VIDSKVPLRSYSSWKIVYVEAVTVLSAYPPVGMVPVVFAVRVNRYHGDPKDRANFRPEKADVHVVPLPVTDVDACVIATVPVVYGATVKTRDSLTRSIQGRAPNTRFAAAFRSWFRYASESDPESLLTPQRAATAARSAPRVS